MVDGACKGASEMGMDNITFISPRYNTMHQPSNQVEWGTPGLRMCDVALFWIPIDILPALKDGDSQVASAPCEG